MSPVLKYLFLFTPLRLGLGGRRDRKGGRGSVTRGAGDGLMSPEDVSAGGCSVVTMAALGSSCGSWPHQCGGH